MPGEALTSLNSGDRIEKKNLVQTLIFQPPALSIFGQLCKIWVSGYGDYENVLHFVMVILLKIILVIDAV
jgi:hypothetical protein